MISNGSDITYIKDIKKLDLLDKYVILKNAQDVFYSLRETDPDFPFIGAYVNGVASLQCALAYLDDKLFKSDSSSKQEVLCFIT